MRQIKLDWTINVGTLMQMLLLIFMLVRGYTGITDRLVNLETKVAVMFNWWEKSVK